MEEWLRIRHPDGTMMYLGVAAIMSAGKVRLVIDAERSVIAERVLAPTGVTPSEQPAAVVLEQK
jgi:hypothetical protein